MLVLIRFGARPKRPAPSPNIEDKKRNLACARTGWQVKYPDTLDITFPGIQKYKSGIDGALEVRASLLEFYPDTLTATKDASGGAPTTPAAASAERSTIRASP